MNCDQSRSLLSAWVDQQLDPTDRGPLEEHLQTCAECRGEAQSLRDFHGELKRAFELPRAQAVRIAEHVVSTLPRQTPTAAIPAQPLMAPVTTPRPEAPITTPRPNWISIGLALAIGFLLALLIFPPWRSRPAGPKAHEPLPDTVVGTPQTAVPVARLVVATETPGVEFHNRTGTSWQPVADLSSFQCPSEGAVRTSPSARCELITSAGCVVRMNCRTEVVFHSAGKVELKRGDIWCRSTPQAPLEVRPSSSAATVESNPSPRVLPPFCCTATDATCLLSVTDSGSEVRVMAAAGNVSLQARDENLQLKPSETATITREHIDQVRPSDRLLAASWMQPLLIRKGYADPELAERVDDLLAQVGESKVSNLYEAEIRSLGEYSVLPLLRYVESPGSSSARGRRLDAMRIASDLAPPWAIGDLIGLLKHPDADVRCLSAAALERLTQENQGVGPKAWRGSPAKLEPARLAWQTWWNQNRDRYPIRFDASQPASPPAEPTPPPVLKTRRAADATSG
jgi:hypothetical protein